MTKNLNRTWFGKWYDGKTAYHFETKLAETLEGNFEWTDPTVPVRVPGAKAERRLSLPAVEALEAATMGLVSQVSINGTSIDFAVSKDAYTDSHSVPGGIKSTQVVAGIEPGTRIIFTNQPSSGSKASTGDGKTELSSFVAVLLLAMNDFRMNGSLRAKACLETYDTLICFLAQAKELPVTGNSAWAKNLTPQSPKSQFGKFVRECADALYLYATWTRTGATQAEQWTIEHRGLNSVPGFRPGQNDMAMMLTDYTAFNGFLNDRQFPRPVVQPVAASAPPPPPPAPTVQPPPAAAVAAAGATAAVTSPLQYKSSLDRIICGLALAQVEAEGGCPNLLVFGPPGTGKTTALEEASDGMPTDSVILDMDTDRRELTVSIERSPSGEWVPELQSFARVCRVAMLKAIQLAFKRGGIQAILARGHSINYLLENKYNLKADATTELLKALEGTPDDSATLAELDRVANPLDTKTWMAVDRAYWESGAALVGPVFRFIFDEIYDSARNRRVQSFLKMVMAKNRPVPLGVAGTLPLYALNVHLCAAGNASSSDRMMQATTSRFQSAVALPRVSESAERDRARTSIANFKKISGTIGSGSKPPVDTSLVNLKYEPPVRDVSEPSDACYERVLEFCSRTRTEYEAQKLQEPLDPRNYLAMMSIIAHMKGAGMPEREAFLATCQASVAKLCFVDSVWGLPETQASQDLLHEIVNLSSKL